MADAIHVALLQDQTDEAVRLLDDQAQATHRRSARRPARPSVARGVAGD